MALDTEVCAEASSGQEAIRAAKRERPIYAWWDVSFAVIGCASCKRSAEQRRGPPPKRFDAAPQPVHRQGDWLFE